jgi:hypothetical protein
MIECEFCGNYVKESGSYTVDMDEKLIACKSCVETLATEGLSPEDVERNE